MMLRADNVLHKATNTTATACRARSRSLHTDAPPKQALAVEWLIMALAMDRHTEHSNLQYVIIIHWQRLSLPVPVDGTAIKATTN